MSQLKNSHLLRSPFQIPAVDPLLKSTAEKALRGSSADPAALYVWLPQLFKDIVPREGANDKPAWEAAVGSALRDQRGAKTRVTADTIARAAQILQIKGIAEKALQDSRADPGGLYAWLSRAFKSVVPTNGASAWESAVKSAQDEQISHGGSQTVTAETIARAALVLQGEYAKVGAASAGPPQ